MWQLIFRCVSWTPWTPDIPPGPSSFPAMCSDERVIKPQDVLFFFFLAHRPYVCQHTCLHLLYDGPLSKTHLKLSQSRLYQRLSTMPHDFTCAPRRQQSLFTPPREVRCQGNRGRSFKVRRSHSSAKDSLNWSGSGKLWGEDFTAAVAPLYTVGDVLYEWLFAVVQEAVWL